MGFGKAFGFSLLAYVGLNFLFIIISYTVSGDLNTIFSSITSDPLILLLILFGPIVYFPGEVFQLIVMQIEFGFTADLLILYIGYIISPFVASLVAGRMGENKGGSFGGWFLTSIASAVAMAVFGFISVPSASTTTLILVLINGIVNGIFYGCFALLFTKTEYY